MRLKHYLSCMLILLSFVTVNAQEKKELKEGDQAPTFKYLDINGKEVSLSDLKGKYVYIDVWATWCGPCQYELPHLKELEKKMHGKKIVFVSISCDKDKAAWEKMVKEQGLGGVQLHNDNHRFFFASHFPPSGEAGYEKSRNSIAHACQLACVQFVPSENSAKCRICLRCLHWTALPPARPRTSPTRISLLYRGRSPTR